MSKLSMLNERIAEKAVACYKKIENGAVGGYKRIEIGVTNGFGKLCDTVIEHVLAKDGETVAEAKKRLSAEK